MGFGQRKRFQVKFTGSCVSKCRVKNENARRKLNDLPRHPEYVKLANRKVILFPFLFSTVKFSNIFQDERTRSIKKYKIIAIILQKFKKISNQMQFLINAKYQNRNKIFNTL